MIYKYIYILYKYIHTYIWLIFVAGKRSYIYLRPPTLGLTVHNSICSMWYGKTRPPGICLVKWARAELASTWWVSPLHYQWNKRCVRCKSLHESTKIPKTPVIWWIRYLTVQKKIGEVKQTNQNSPLLMVIVFGTPPNCKNSAKNVQSWKAKIPKICQKEAAKGQKLVQKKFWSTSRPSPLHLVLFEQPWPVARPQGFEWTLRTWTGPMDQTIFEVANARVQVLCISAQYFKLKSLKSSYQIDLDWTIPNTVVIATRTPPAEESLEPRTQMEIGGHLSAILGFTRKLTVIFCILCFLCRSWSFLLGDGDSNGKSFSTESLLYLIYP